MKDDGPANSFLGATGERKAYSFVEELCHLTSLLKEELCHLTSLLKQDQLGAMRRALYSHSSVFEHTFWPNIPDFWSTNP
jgi:hypothetical protein